MFDANLKSQIDQGHNECNGFQRSQINTRKQNADFDFLAS